MSEKVVVYKALASAADQVIDALRREGFHPGKLEDMGGGQFHTAGLGEPYYRRGQWLDRVHITVPREEAEYAKSFLRKWDERCGKDVAALTGGLGKALWVSLIPGVLVGVAAAVCGAAIENAAMVSVLAWGVGFVIVANAGRVRGQERRAKDGRRSGRR